jgi:hypothetical protein
MRACCRQPPAVLDYDETGGRELEGKMLTKTVFVIAICGAGAIVPASAQDEARIFQYSPVAQLVGEGQYRAEVWRRENASGKEERAWSSSDLLGSSEDAVAAACTILRENFASSCSQASRGAKAGEPVKASAMVVTKEAKPPKEKAAKASPAVPLPAPKAPALTPPASKAISAASKPGANHLDNDFWANQSRFGGGSGGGSQ